jgi:hypothetical protein
MTAIFNYALVIRQTVHRPIVRVNGCMNMQRLHVSSGSGGVRNAATISYNNRLAIDSPRCQGQSAHPWYFGT